MWQYKAILKESEYSIKNYIRPLNSNNNSVSFWEFDIYSITDDIEQQLQLSNGDFLKINNIKINKNIFEINVTWTHVPQLWNNLKNKNNISQLFEGTSNNILDLLNNDTNLDSNLDKAIIFFNKMSNYIQILQDKLNDPNCDHELKEFSTIFDKVTKNITYTSHFHF
tara:strand:- start:57 stop:557 length:501 start_codon:yes stop_codon:yes gene_type:complete